MSDQGIREALARERRDLIKAEKDIVEGLERIAQQRLLIETLADQGHDTGQARILLFNFEQMLDAWREHRILIRDRITVLENG